jgi:hypothetical protein
MTHVQCRSGADSAAASLRATAIGAETVGGIDPVEGLRWVLLAKSCAVLLYVRLISLIELALKVRRGRCHPPELPMMAT